MSHPLRIPGWAERRVIKDPHPTSIPRAGRQHRAPAHLLAAGTVFGEGSSAAARLNEQGAGTATGTGLPRAALPALRKG